MKLYAAIDLHSTNSFLTVVDQDDHALIERRFPNNLTRLLDALEPYRGSLQGIAVESTYNWYWLVDGLQDGGYRVHLVTRQRSSSTKGSSVSYKNDSDPFKDFRTLVLPK